MQGFRASGSLGFRVLGFWVLQLSGFRVRGLGFLPFLPTDQPQRFRDFRFGRHSVQDEDLHSVPVTTRIRLFVGSRFTGGGFESRHAFLAQLTAPTSNFQKQQASPALQTSASAGNVRTWKCISCSRRGAIVILSEKAYSVEVGVVQQSVRKLAINPIFF